MYAADEGSTHDKNDLRVNSEKTIYHSPLDALTRCSSSSILSETEDPCLPTTGRPGSLSPSRTGESLLYTETELMADTGGSTGEVGDGSHAGEAARMRAGESDCAYLPGVCLGGTRARAGRGGGGEGDEG